MISYTKRPLTTLELQHLLAVEVGEAGLDDQNISERLTIIPFCARLAIVDEESDIISLIHYATQEYFERTRMQWFPSAEKDITEACIAYLSFHTFSRVCSTHEDFETRLAVNTAYNYAAIYRGHHALAAALDVGDVILSFLQKEAQVSAYGQVLLMKDDQETFFIEEGFLQLLTVAHLAAYFGLRRV